MFTLQLKTGELTTLPKPAVMGVINVSPDSFYNAHQSLDQVIETATQIARLGVDIIDIGGEATNPKINLKDRFSAKQEIELVVPAIQAIRKFYSGLISVDTSKAQVMREAIAAGADMINDQRALTEKDALMTVAQLKVPVILMHFFHGRSPGSTSPDQMLNDIKHDLLSRITAARSVGINEKQIIIDPGFGQGNYGKNCEENFYLLSKLPELIELGYPVLAGWSRKSMIGEALGGVAAEERLYGTVAANTLATYLGAHILRVHDVKAAQDAAKIATQLSNIKFCSPVIT